MRHVRLCSRRIHILIHARLGVVIELIVNLLRGLCRELGDHEDAEKRDDESRQKLVDAEHAAERLDEVMPNHHRDRTAEHARERAGQVRATPIQAAQHKRAERCAKARQA